MCEDDTASMNNDHMTRVVIETLYSHSIVAVVIVSEKRCLPELPWTGYLGA